MHNIFESPKRAIASVVGGIYISIAVTSKYNIPELEEWELAQNKISIALLEIHKWMNGYSLTSLIVALFFAGIIWISLYKEKEFIKSKLLFFVSIVFGILNTVGLYMYYLDRLPISIGGVATLYMIFLAVGWACVFFIAAIWIMKGFRCLEKQTIKTYRYSNKFISFYGRHIFACSFIIMFFAWSIWVISYYPASMDWDVFRQLNSYLGNNGGYPSNHDPWFSTCVLGTFYKIGVKIGSENLGIFLYVFFRDIAMALIYAEGIEILKKHKVNIHICLAICMFYAITPVWGAYAKHAFKDTFAAALFCWFVLNVIQLVESIANETVTWKSCVVYSISAVGVSLFRNNCIYAVVPTTILVIIYMLYEKNKLRYIVITLLGIAMYFGYNSYVTNVVGVKHGSSVEAFSIPFQQTARVVKKYPDEITNKEKKVISKVLEYETLGEYYDPIISDPVKSHSTYDDCTDEEKKEYFILWIKMFFKHPITYIEAAIGQSYGYYAFTPNLPYGAGNYNSGMTIFNWIGAENGKGYNVHYIEKFKNVRDTLNSWSKAWDEIPMLNITDSCAAYTWLIILIGIYKNSKKKYSEIIPLIALLVLVLTCMASPVNDCFRYYSPVAASTPMLAMLFGKIQKKMNKKEGKENG